MAYEINIGADVSFPAGADLTGKQFLFAVLNGSSQAIVAGANVSCVGVIQDEPAAATRGVDVRCLGVSKVKLGGTVTVNDKVASDAAGKGVKATAASVSAGTPEPLAGSYVMGIALASGVSGDVIPVLLTHAGITN
jgi:hypothetical protein